MTQYFNLISRYFRQSLIDADRLCPEDKDILPVLGPDKNQDPRADYMALSASLWQQGRVDPDLAEKIIEERQPKNKPPLQQLEIVIFPRIDHLNYQTGERDQRKRRVLMPLVVFVSLQRDGSLQPTNTLDPTYLDWSNPKCHAAFHRNGLTGCIFYSASI